MYVANIVAYIYLILGGLAVLLLVVFFGLITSIFGFFFSMGIYVLTCGYYGHRSFTKFMSVQWGAATSPLSAVFNGGLCSQTQLVIKYDMLGSPEEEEEKRAYWFWPLPPLSTSNPAFAFQLGSTLICVVAITEYFTGNFVNFYIQKLENAGSSIGCWGQLVFMQCESQSNGTSGTGIYDIIDCPDGYDKIKVLGQNGDWQMTCAPSSYDVGWNGIGELYATGSAIVYLSYIKIWTYLPRVLSMTVDLSAINAIWDQYATFEQYLQGVVVLRVISSFLSTLSLRLFDRQVERRARRDVARRGPPAEDVGKAVSV